MNSDSLYVHCRNCGEQNLRDNRDCWLCHSPLEYEDEDTSGVGKSYRRKSTAPRPKSTFVTTEFLMVTTVILLTIGMATNRMWGLAILMWIVLLPVGLSIRFRSGKKIVASEPETGEEKLGRFSSSVFVTIGFVIVVILAAGIGFFLTCAVGFAGGMTLGQAAGAKGYDPFAWGFYTGASLGSVAGIFIAYKLIRQFRWRKEI